MRIVAFEAIANRRRMNGAFDLGGVFIGVAGDTEAVYGGCGQFYSGDIFIDPDFVATQTAHCDGGMDGLAFDLSSWHSRHLAASTFLSSGTG